MSHRAGLLAVATHLPPRIRTNDWWPADVVDRWRSRRPTPPTLPETGPTEAMARVRAAMSQQAADPFQGVVERRVLADELSSVDMEVEAAERAIARSGVDRRDINLVLTHTAVPDHLLGNPAAELHHRLGLAPDCFSMQVEASAFSLMMQLTVAEQMILAGRTRFALLVQSFAGSRLIERDDPRSPLFGDGAAASVVGPVAHGGVLSSVCRTDGAYSRTLIAAVRGGRWFDDGPAVLHEADPDSAGRLFLNTADWAIDVVGAALDQAGLSPADIDVYASHQGISWLREVTQESVGLAGARTVDTTATSGYLFAVSIPLVLETALAQGLLKPGDNVVLFGGGTGVTYGSIVLRWAEPPA